MIIMSTKNIKRSGTKLVLSGKNVALTAAMKAVLEEKARRLFRHEPRLVRVRIGIEDVSRGGVAGFIAKGHVEIEGPDLVASVTSDNAYKSVGMLIDRLDRALRKRTTARTMRRNSDDIRRHLALVPAAETSAWLK
jgi:putative sigma-54 modulation protein